MTPLIRINGYAAVAMEYGVEESIVLDSIVYWARTNRSENRNFYDGRWWTYNSINGMAEMFPWWSKKQIRRILDKCADQGALLKGNYNKDGRDRTIWYSPSDKLLALYGEDWSAKCICPNGQIHVPKRANHYHVITTMLMPPIIPQIIIKTIKPKSASANRNLHRYISLIDLKNSGSSTRAVDLGREL